MKTKHMLLSILLVILFAPIVYSVGIDGFTGGTNSPEITTKVFELLGIPIETFMWLSALVTIIVQAIKKQLPLNWVGKEKSLALVLLVSFGLSCYAFFPAWDQIIPLTVGLWLAPVGVKQLLNKSTSKDKQKE